MKNIIITCWTSLISNLKKYWINFNKDEENVLETLEKEEKSDQSLDIENKINEYLKSNSLKQICAEIKSVFVLEEKWFFEKKDSIYLFYSQTEIWKRLAFIIQDKLKKEGFNNIETKLIDWFIVKNRWIWEDKKANKIFKSKAIPDFYTKLEGIKSNWNKTIMCPVWGYKALIPYASLYAMVNGWDIKYIYEDSEELMDLSNWLLWYLNIKNWITDTSFIDVINELEKWEKSIFTQNIDFNFTSKLVEATNRFIELWDLSWFNKIEIKDEKINELIEKLLEIDMQLKLLWLRKSSFSEIINKLEKIKDIDNNIYSPIFNKIKNELLIYFSNSKEKYEEKNDLEFYFSCLKFYHDKKRISEEFLFFREFVVDIIQFFIFKKIVYKKFKHPNWENNTFKKDIRQYVEWSIHFVLDDNIEKKDNFQYITNIPDEEYLKTEKDEENIKNLLSNFKNDIKILNNLRNDIAHLSNLSYDDTFKIINDYNKNDTLVKKQEVISNYFFNSLEKIKIESQKTT